MAQSRYSFDGASPAPASRMTRDQYQTLNAHTTFHIDEPRLMAAAARIGQTEQQIAPLIEHQDRQRADQQ